MTCLKGYAALLATKGGIFMTKQVTKIYLAGDSIAQSYGPDRAPLAGWGQFISDYFTDDVKFVNKSIAGRSSKTFVMEGRLDEILNEIGENDYLFILLGHNDSTVERPQRYTEPYTEYKQYLRMFIDGARKHGATPVLVTPAPKLNYKDNKFVMDFADYCAAMKQVAEEENVKIIDLMSKCLEYLTSVGYDEAYTMYMISKNGTDIAHLTEKGANRIAGLVAEGVKELNIDISKYVKI